MSKIAKWIKTDDAGYNFVCLRCSIGDCADIRDTKKEARRELEAFNELHKSCKEK